MLRNTSEIYISVSYGEPILFDAWQLQATCKEFSPSPRQITDNMKQRLLIIN
jgi:hypothetical protein